MKKHIFLIAALCAALCILFSGAAAQAYADSDVLTIEEPTLLEINERMQAIVDAGGTDAKVEIWLRGEYNGGEDWEHYLEIPDGLTRYKGPDAVGIYGDNAVVHGMIHFGKNDGYILRGVTLESPNPGKEIALQGSVGAGPAFVAKCTFKNYSTAIDSYNSFIAPSDGNTFDSCELAVKMYLNPDIGGVNQDPWERNTFINCEQVFYIGQLYEWFGPNSLQIRNNTFIGTTGTDFSVYEPGNYYFPDNTFLDADHRLREPIASKGVDVSINFGKTGESLSDTLVDASGNGIDITVSKDWGTVVVSGGVSASAPVLIASYGEDGRFLGLSTVTVPSEKVGAEEGAQTVKVLWIDAAGFAPKTGPAAFSLK